MMYLKNKRSTWCHLLPYFTSYVLNTFQTLIFPSSGACDCAVELPHRSFCSWFTVCWRFGAAGFEWCPCCRLQHGHHSNPAATELQHTANQNKTTDVVIQQHSRKLLMMAILMSETCWVHKKWNKTASDIKLVLFFNYYNDAWSKKHKIHHMMYSVGQVPYNLLNKINLILLTSHVLRIPNGSFQKKNPCQNCSYIHYPPIFILCQLIPSFRYAKNDGWSV